VLRVDDDPATLDLTATCLEREGLTVETEASAREGLDRLATNGDIDCVVGDYDMPGMDGLRFLQAVREGFSERPFVLFTDEGSEEIANEAAAGFVRAENVEALVGRQALEFVYPADAEAVSGRLERVFAERKRFPSTERRYVGVDGETRYAVAAAAPMTFEDQPAAQIVLNDVTDSTRIEWALRREREFVESTLDTLEDVFYIVDEDGAFVRWNDRLEKVSGYTDAQIGSMAVLDFFEGASAERIAGVHRGDTGNWRCDH